MTANGASSTQSYFTAVQTLTAAMPFQCQIHCWRNLEESSKMRGGSVGLKSLNTMGPKLKLSRVAEHVFNVQEYLQKSRLDFLKSTANA